jgi:hypothetical protein
MRLMMGMLVVLAGCAAKPPEKTAAVREAPPPFCTRTLGVAECFTDPAALPDHPSPLMDTPVRPVQPPVPWWKKVADHWD